MITSFIKHKVKTIIQRNPVGNLACLLTDMLRCRLACQQAGWQCETDEFVQFRTLAIERKGPVVQRGQTVKTLNTSASTVYPTGVLRFRTRLIEDPVMSLIGDFHHERQVIAAEAG